MIKRHKFKRVFMSGLTTKELWECPCGITATSNWDDKTDIRTNRKIGGPENCKRLS